MTLSRLREILNCNDQANIIPIVNQRTGPALRTDADLLPFIFALKIDPYLKNGIEKEAEIIVAKTKKSIIRFAQRHKKISSDKIFRW